MTSAVLFRQMQEQDRQIMFFYSLNSRGLRETWIQGFYNRGWDFRQMLEMAPGQQGDLSFIGWALDSDQVKVHRLDISKMCAALERLPWWCHGRHLHRQIKFLVGLSVFFWLKYQSSTWQNFSLENRHQSDNNNNRKHKIVSSVNTNKTKNQSLCLTSKAEAVLTCFKLPNRIHIHLKPFLLWWATIPDSVYSIV